MKTTTKLTLGVAACSLGLSAAASAASFTFLGGNARLGASWENDGDNTTGTLPGVGDTGSIATGGFANGQLSGNLSGAVITQSSGTITANGFNWSGAAASSTWNLEGGILDATPGGNNFNVQNTTINISGGEFRFAAQLLTNNATGTYNISGNAILTSTADFDVRLNQNNSTFEIASDWTGSFVSADDDTEADWINQLVYGAGIIGPGIAANFNADRVVTVGGTAITDANFADYFVVTAGGGGGSTLTLVPEPSSAALLGLGGLALILRRRK